MSKPHGSYLPKAKVAEDRAWHFYDESFQAEYPALFELLAATKQEGTVRESASLSVFVADGRLKAVLTDKHTKMAFWCTLKGGPHVLAELDQALQDGSGEWRAVKEGWFKK